MVFISQSTQYNNLKETGWLGFRPDKAYQFITLMVKPPKSNLTDWLRVHVIVWWSNIENCVKTSWLIKKKEMTLSEVNPVSVICKDQLTLLCEGPVTCKRDSYTMHSSPRKIISQGIETISGVKLIRPYLFKLKSWMLLPFT